MSTTKTVSVLKGVESQVRVRAPGKWDSTVNHTFNSSGDSLSITTSTYDGLNVQNIDGYNTANILDFSNTVLPWKFDYSSTLSVSRFCLMPAYACSIYGTVVGAVSFDNIWGKVQINTVPGMSCIYYPPIYGKHYGSYEICTRFKITDMTVDNQPILAIKDASIIMIKGVIKTSGQSMLVKVLRNSVEQTVLNESEATIEINKWYTLKLIGSGSGCKVQLEDDFNEYILWSGSQIYNLWSNDMTWIGGYFEGTQGIIGEIDLKKTWFKKDWSSSLDDWATIVWLGTEDNNTLQIYQNIDPAQLTYNIDIEGDVSLTDPTIYGYASNFGDGNYIKSKTTNVLSVGKTFKFKIQVGSDVQTSQLILKQSGFNNLYINNGYFTTYNYQTQQDETITSVTAYYSYWIKITFLSTSKVFSISTDGINYTDYIINDSVYGSSSNTEYLYIGHKPDDRYFKGSIYLASSFTNIEENNIIVWQPIAVSSSGNTENLYGCFIDVSDNGDDLSYNCYVVENDQRIILTNNENFTDGYYLGKVRSLNHNVYSYNNGVWTQIVSLP